MKSVILSTIFLLLTTVVGFAQSTFQGKSIEDGWKGIKVFHTTKAEVEKILGESTEESNGELIYRTKEANVWVLHAENPCSTATLGRGEYNLNKGTVIEYRVILKKPIKLSELKWEKKVYERYEDTHLLGLIHYGNLKAGVSFRAEVTDGNKENEAVGGFEYNPTKEQVDNFKCEKQLPLTSNQEVFEKENLNLKIVPLVTKEAEIEKLFGKPISVGNQVKTYKAKLGKITVSYGGVKAAENSTCKFNVSLDTVKSVSITLSEAIPIAGIKLDYSNFKKHISHLGDLTYHNDEKGIAFVTYETDNKEELIMRLGYYPTDNDEKGCP